MPNQLIQHIQGTITDLKVELATLYYTQEMSRNVALHALLDVNKINMQGDPESNWRNILFRAIEEEKLVKLIQAALKQHPESEVLLTAGNVFFQQNVEGTADETIDGDSEEELLQELLDYLDRSFVGFKAQARNRDKLFHQIQERLQVPRTREFEEFFSLHYKSMDEQEKRQHGIIRKYTDVIKTNNAKSLAILQQLPNIEDKIEQVKELILHLEFWLFKYENIFLEDETMCLVYTGVTDGLPFPRGVDQKITTYLDQL